MNLEQISEGTRATYKGKEGTVVSIALHGAGYFNPDSNKRGNDGIILVMLDELTVTN